MSLVKLCSKIFQLCDSLDSSGDYTISDNIVNVVNRIAQQQKPYGGLPVIDITNPYNVPNNKSPLGGEQITNKPQQQSKLPWGDKKENPTYNPKSIPKTAQPYLSAFVEASRATGYPVKLLLSLSFVESSFNPKAKSSVGAYGLMQLYPATPEQQEPAHNILDGAQKLKNYHNMFGNIEAGLAAYNWGPTNMRRVGGDYRKAPGSVQQFVQKVLEGQKNYA